MNADLLAVLMFALGAVLRPVLLYLREWLDTKEAFDWRYLVGQIIGVAIMLIPMIYSWAQQLSGASLTLALTLGWASADIGREIQKTIAPRFTGN